MPKDRWSMDSVWYNFQSILKKFNLNATRDYVKKLIRELCRDKGVTREEIGIFAGARATMYFDGQWSSVSFDAIGALAQNGTDIIVIEKMAIVQVLAPYADKYGIAIVNTSGYFTEYGQELMQAAEDTGGHVMILTDYDMTGLHIASKAIGITRIGIDEETLDYFGLDKYDPSLSLSYEPHPKHLRYLQQLLNVKDQRVVLGNFEQSSLMQRMPVLEKLDIWLPETGYSLQRQWPHLLYWQVHEPISREYQIH